jgi:uncharacterized iron-regulated membrane protein
VRNRRRLRRLHVWLGWIAGVPLLFWTLSGAVMVVLPIETVRGTHLLAEPAALSLSGPPVPPDLGRRAAKSIALEQRAAGPRWIVRYADGAAARADAGNGRILPDLSAEEAAAEVRARYQGELAIASVERTAADDPPLDLRRPIATWRVETDDGTRFYVDAATGEISARRTALWRFFDFMWGLHILDLGTRENINNIWVRVFAVVGLLSVVVGLILLPLVTRRRRRRRSVSAGTVS